MRSAFAISHCPRRHGLSNGLALGCHHSPTQGCIISGIELRTVGGISRSMMGWDHAGDAPLRRTSRCLTTRIVWAIRVTSRTVGLCWVGHRVPRPGRELLSLCPSEIGSFAGYAPHRTMVSDGNQPPVRAGSFAVGEFAAMNRSIGVTLAAQPAVSRTSCAAGSGSSRWSESIGRTSHQHCPAWLCS
jgi:hypothetical protein